MGQLKMKTIRELNETEIAHMNEVKEVGKTLGDLVERIKGIEGVDQRWVAIGATDLQKGLMALTRSIAKPEFF